jgi:glycosyltransferase involved in cell wall biosynthesis
MRSRKDIAYINGRFLTRPLTGVERTAYELVLALDKLLADQPGTTYQYILIYSGMLCNPIALKRIQLVKKGVFTGNLWEQLELPFYTGGSLLISMCTISSLFKRKQLLTVHDASFMAQPQFFPSAVRNWYKLAIPFLGRRIRKLITVSAFSKAELIKYFGFKEEHVVVIYNAADHLLRFNEPSDHFRKKINALKPYVLAVSSMSANKNFRGLSKEVEQINFKGHRMLIAGGIIPTLKQVSLPGGVNYLGYVSNEELRYLYANASLFVFPSFYEGFGIPPLEAMIAGSPVLASNTSSMPEVLNDACEYFDPYNEGDLAAKIQLLLDDEDRLRSLTMRGQRQAALYSWQHSAKKLHLLIEKYAD